MCEQNILTRIDVDTWSRHLLPYLNLQDVQKLMITGDGNMQNRLDTRVVGPKRFNDHIPFMSVSHALRLPKCISSAAFDTVPLHLIPEFKTVLQRMCSVDINIDWAHPNEMLQLLADCKVERLGLSASLTSEPNHAKYPFDKTILTKCRSITELRVVSVSNAVTIDSDDIAAFSALPSLISLRINCIYIDDVFERAIHSFSGLKILRLAAVFRAINVDLLPRTLIECRIKCHALELQNGTLEGSEFPPNLERLTLKIASHHVTSTPSYQNGDRLIRLPITITRLCFDILFAPFIDRLSTDPSQPGIASLTNLFRCSIRSVKKNTNLDPWLERLPSSCNRLSITNTETIAHRVSLAYVEHLTIIGCDVPYNIHTSLQHLKRLHVRIYGKVTLDNCILAWSRKVPSADTVLCAKCRESFDYKEIVTIIKMCVRKAGWLILDLARDTPKLVLHNCNI